MTPIVPSEPIDGDHLAPRPSPGGKPRLNPSLIDLPDRA
jgi:hypothetical protein